MEKTLFTNNCYCISFISDLIKLTHIIHNTGLSQEREADNKKTKFIDVVMLLIITVLLHYLYLKILRSMVK